MDEREAGEALYDYLLGRPRLLGALRSVAQGRQARGTFQERMVPEEYAEIFRLGAIQEAPPTTYGRLDIDGNSVCRWQVVSVEMTERGRDILAIIDARSAAQSDV